MWNTADLLAVVFFLAAIFYLLMGILLFFLRPKSFLSKLYFILLLAAIIWANGYAFSIDASTYENCLFWRKISIIGSSFFFIVLFHLSLHLTGFNLKLKKYLNNRFVEAVIYLPGILSAIFFIEDKANAAFLFVKTSWGWVDSIQSSALDIFIKSYSAIYFALALIMIFLWSRKKENEEFKNSVILLILAFLAVIGADIVIAQASTYLLNTSLPPVTPIFLATPLMILFAHLIRIEPNLDRKSPLQEYIIGGLSRKAIFYSISLLFFIGCLLNFLVFYFIYKEELQPVLFRSLMMASSGLFLLIINKMKIEDYQKDLLASGVMGLLVPLVTISFLQYGAVTVWAVSFVFLLPFSVFRQRMPMVILSISILVTQVIVWIVVPEVDVSINVGDYLTRIFFFTTYIGMVFFLNHLFIKRIEDGQKKVDLQGLISTVSTECIGITANNLNLRIRELLEKIGEFFQVDHVYICLFDMENKTFSGFEEYICQEISLKSKLDQLQNIPINEKHWRMQKIMSNEVFVVSDMSSLPEAINREMEEMELMDIKSQMIIPISVQDQILGYWGMNTRTRIYEWNDDHIYFSRLLANILGDTFVRLNSEKEKTRLAYYDRVTSLPNRVLFEESLNAKMINTDDNHQELAVIFLDLDSFKTINDTVGHNMGDKLLMAVGKKAKGILKEDDIVSRFSGDEFVMMVNGSRNEIIRIAEELMQLFYEAFILNGQDFYVTACAGIAMYPQDGNDPRTLIMNADIARFVAKEKGHNQYFFCSETIKNEAMERNQITNYLYRSLEKEELFLQYQPQVSLKDNRIVGAEALLRWENSEIGRIRPDVLIPLAESTGLINPIGDWILKTACQQCKKWQRMGLPEIIIGVNISASQFNNPNFVENVKNVLAETKLEPQYLEIEITESVAIQEFNDIVKKLTELKALGISIAIDDFGAEYSSLGRIKALPLSRLKMDKQFVDGIGFNEKDQEIAKAIINLGKSLGLSVIAEGAEDDSQIDFLKSTQCDDIQGYYFYRPLDAKILESILEGEKDLKS